MTYKILTKEELRKMTVKQIKAIDITSVDYEKVVNEVLNEKATTVPPVIKLREKSYDPKSPEEEAKVQSEVDAFRTKHTPIEAQIVEAEKDLENVTKEVEVITVPAPIPEEPSTVTSAEVTTDSNLKKPSKTKKVTTN